ncbi:MAG: alcohol dehydrogenase catalytic domain-containing protein [Candidatus Binatia bacterium]
MRVAMYYNNRDVRLEEMPVPSIGPGELLVRIRASGICGTDVMEWYRIKKAPLVLGHEIAGEIASVGEGENRFRPGDRVFVSHHVPCNRCRYCLSGHHSVCDTLRQTRFDPGGFAEYIRVPKINVDLGTFLLPEELSFEEGSFIEPVACVVRGQRIAGLNSKQSVLVIGSGISGLLHIQLARAHGAERVVATDINKYRLKMAGELGADTTILATENVPARLREANDGRLADLVIVCSGATTAIHQALETVERGGTLLFFATAPEGVGVSIPLYEFWRNEVTITTSYAGSPQDITEAIELLRNHRVRVREMISHRLDLSEAGLGFQLVAGARDSIKVIIEPQPH